jgi:hypothetical protein
MTDGLIFWGNPSHDIKISKSQKRAIRILMGCGFRESGGDLFKRLNILPLKSHDILSLIMLVVNNRDCFISNKDCHCANARQSNNLHLPQVNLTVFKMGVYYSDVKVFNSTPL